MRLSKMAVAVVTATAAVGIIGFGAPAMANTSSSCATNNYWHWDPRTCTTGSIKANKAHDIRVSGDVCVDGNWRVTDVSNGKTVGSGKGKGDVGSSKRHFDIVLHGVYGTYKAKISSTCYKDDVRLADY